ncbi:MAG: alpha/beta fold hydrolase [Burkholderiaceae bacterium]|nr:alpha/beta fold hydrolase [Burkholderiaceae bacterium]
MNTPIRAPHWMLLGTEPVRAAVEYLRMRSMDIATLPRGDGHPVVVFPGLAANQASTAPLVGLCRTLGYAACDWGRGFNTGPRGDVTAWLDELARHVHALTARDARTISLIGWSLGGFYAREVAKRLRGRVRQVVSVGTPFAGRAEHTHAAWVYRLVNGRAPAYDDALMKQLRTPPDVPTTSVFSRSDGIVAWQTCLQDGGPCAENIEVDGSHCGLGWNARVFTIIADRLSQPENAWRPYAGPALAKARTKATSAAPRMAPRQAG